MSSYHPKRCRLCGVTRDDAHISKRGLCPTCGDANLTANARAISTRQGPAFDKWAECWRAACGANGRPITPYTIEP